MDVYLIEGPWRGTLSIIPRPRGGDWLEDDLLRLELGGVTTIVSLLEHAEEADLGLEREHDFARKIGLQFLSLPIPDRDIPSSGTTTVRELSEIERLLESGAYVGIHCRQGIGRSSLIAAALLIMAGSSATDAIESIKQARGLDVPETDSQRKWIRDFETAVHG